MSKAGFHVRPLWGMSGTNWWFKQTKEKVSRFGVHNLPSNLEETMFDKFAKRGSSCSCLTFLIGSRKVTWAASLPNQLMIAIAMLYHAG